MNLVWHGNSTPFETKSPAAAVRHEKACRVTAVLIVVPNLIQPAELNGFKRRATAMFKSN